MDTFYNWQKKIKQFYALKVFSNRIDNLSIKIDNIIMTLGEKIVKLREENRMSDEELARKIEVSIATLEAFYKDEKKPTDDELRKMSDLFHCRVSYLTDEGTDEVTDDDETFVNDKFSQTLRKRFDKTHVKLFSSSGALMILGIIAFILGAIFFNHFEYEAPAGLDIIVYIVASLAIIASIGCFIMGVITYINSK